MWMFDSTILIFAEHGELLALGDPSKIMGMLKLLAA